MKIELEFISSDLLESKKGKEKMDFIIKKIKENKILVIEDSLSPLEEGRLIEETMKQINQEFPGIEVSTLREKTDRGVKGKFIKFLGGRMGGLTVIGPSRLIKRIRKEPKEISMVAEV